MVIPNSVGLFMEETFVPLLRLVDNALAATDQSVHTCERFTNGSSVRSLDSQADDKTIDSKSAQA